MRAFLALTLPDAVADALEALQSALPVGRMVQRANMHLTLVFLGEQPDDLVEEMHRELQALHAPAFEVELGGLGTFGARSPGALYVSARKSAPLVGLQSRLRSRATGCGMILARERFVPHVTLARFPPRLPEGELRRIGRFLGGNADFSMPPFPARDFSLFRSTLGRGAPIHDELARYPLG